MTYFLCRMHEGDASYCLKSSDDKYSRSYIIGSPLCITKVGIHWVQSLSKIKKLIFFFTSLTFNY